MYKEVGISSNNVPITLSIWYTERSSPTIVFLPELFRRGDDGNGPAGDGQRH